MKKWALLLFLIAIPVLAQSVDSMQLKVDALGDSIQTLGRRMEKIEERWVEIGKDAEASRKYGDRTVAIVLAVGALIVGALVMYGVINTLRVERDLKEIRGMKEKAETDCKAIKTIREEIEAIAKKIDYMNQGYHYSSQKKYKEALEAFENAIKEDPKNANAWFQKGNCLSKLGRYEEALNAFDEAIRLKSNFAEAHNNRGTALSKLNRLEESLKAHEQAIKIKPDSANAYYNRGVTLDELGRHEEALKAFDKAIRSKPDFTDAHYNRGVTLDELGHYEKALKAFDEAIRLKPDFAEAYYNRGVTLRKLGRHEEALKAYDEAIRLKPDYADAYSNRASALGKWGVTLKGKQAREKFVEARKNAEKAIELSKGETGYYNLACAQARLGDLDEALGSLRKSKESGEDFPGNAHAWEDDDFTPLRKGKYRKRFIEIVDEKPKPSKNKKK
jgi:tetratricopeptide (TPR) repeat protein